MEEGVFGLTTEPSRVPVVYELSDGFHRMSSSRPKKRSEGVRAVILASAFAAFIFGEEVYGARKLDVESIQNKSCNLNWRGAGGGLKAAEALINGGTGIMTEDDRFLVELARQLFLKRRIGA